MKINKVLFCCITMNLIMATLLFIPRTFSQDPELTDTQIQSAVEDEIAVDPAVRLLNVTVGVDNGVVTLSGRVDNILARDRALRIAETVKGVRGVLNEIEVEPAINVSDDELRQDIIEAIDLNPATDPANLEVSVSDAVATISGTVRSYQEKLFIIRLAKAIRGVREVVDEMDIEVGRDISPGTIKASVERALDWDTLVDDALIEVQVDGATVELSGIVGSQAEKQRAISHAWVAGVNAVDGSDLDVAEWARSDRLRGTKYSEKSDEDIRQAIEEILENDPAVNGQRVAVTVIDGAVTLEGEVDSIQARRAAERDVSNTVGVIRVINRLRVMEDPEMDDAVITNNLRGAIMRDPYLNEDDITPVVTSGLVYLYGEVDSFYKRSHADEIAGAVPGVMGIINNIDVRNTYTPFRFDPYLNDYVGEDREYYRHQGPYSIKNDTAIESDIENHLWWSPYVNGRDVVVNVENGVATLSGTVRTVNERNEAREQAYEGGARWVINNLVVGQ